MHVEVGGMVLIITTTPVEPLVIKVVTSIYKHWALPSFISRLAALGFMDEVGSVYIL